MGETHTAQQFTLADIVGVWQKIDTNGKVSELVIAINEDMTVDYLRYSSDQTFVQTAKGVLDDMASNAATKVNITIDNTDFIYDDSSDHFALRLYTGGYLYVHWDEDSSWDYDIFQRVSDDEDVADFRAMIADPEGYAQQASHKKELSRNNASLAGYTDVTDAECPAVLINNAPGYWYYDRLTADEKAIYDACLAIDRYPDIEKIKARLIYPTNPDDERDSDNHSFIDALEKVTYSIGIDHPELNLFSTSSLLHKTTAETDDGYEVTIYRNRTALSYVGELAMPYAEELSAAADAFLAGIDLTRDPAVVELDIHDALIGLVSYDTEEGEITAEERWAAFEAGETSSLEDNLPHCAYGALVHGRNGVPNLAVCSGYAQAFQFLLQRAGIEAVNISGTATNSQGITGGHEWTSVCLGGEWYETDTTWDDQDYPEYQHIYFNLTHDQMAYTAATDSSYTIHTAGANEDVDVSMGEIHDSVKADYPIATGVTYTYSAVAAMRGY